MAQTVTCRPPYDKSNGNEKACFPMLQLCPCSHGWRRESQLVAALACIFSPSTSIVPENSYMKVNGSIRCGTRGVIDSEDKQAVALAATARGLRKRDAAPPPSTIALGDKIKCYKTSHFSSARRAGVPRGAGPGARGAGRRRKELNAHLCSRTFPDNNN
ncbi:hypothetical protein EVAR_26843_1 [Eumeta japonica]|uniref:Uncharacterized protein n=1 Tax=Eumeta variegata TaxID=151549 RepID=A0A4C1VVH3_EUMVA|nr:hypothetical protein EVAR_26843_1 [Eumeta japonica]